MGTARESHTATLLASGQVLVAGGRLGYSRYNLSPEVALYRTHASVAVFSALASVELYDPASNQWSPAASMSDARRDHAAILLPSGKVLVAGGGTGAFPSEAVLASAELYDPASGSWSPAASMSAGRQSQEATLLPSGDVLMTGGCASADRCSEYIISTVDRYHPNSDTWQRAASMHSPRVAHTATLLPSGKVLVTGGNSSSSYLASAELYDPSSDTWSWAASMSMSRAGHRAILLPSGKVLVIGGRTGSFSSNSVLASSELYDPISDTWSSAGSMSRAHDMHAAALLASGQVLVFGGVVSDNGFVPSASAELYDPAGKSWSPAADMVTARFDATATLLASGRVLAVGGYGPSGYLASAEIYNP